MSGLILGTIIIVMAAFIVSALNQIERLRERVEELEWDNRYGNS